VSGGAEGSMPDVRIRAREMERLNDMLTKYMSENVGKKLADVKTAMDRDNFMSPTEAIEFGIIDKIVSSWKDT